MKPPFRPFVGDGRLEPELVELYRQEVENQCTFAAMTMDRMVAIEKLVQGALDQDAPVAESITLELLGCRPGAPDRCGERLGPVVAPGSLELGRGAWPRRAGSAAAGDH